MVQIGTRLRRWWAQASEWPIPRRYLFDVSGGRIPAPEATRHLPFRGRLLILATESVLTTPSGLQRSRGFVDRKLKQEGLPSLDNNCETYELKQACLAGVYGLKQALRWAMLAADRYAIVVSADIAEYELGSSGEPTQGAGAVAMLVGQHPTLLEIDPRFSGSASVDRETDFRKPLSHQSERSKERHPPQ